MDGPLDSQAITLIFPLLGILTVITISMLVGHATLFSLIFGFILRKLIVQSGSSTEELKCRIKLQSQNQNASAQIAKSHKIAGFGTSRTDDFAKGIDFDQSHAIKNAPPNKRVNFGPSRTDDSTKGID